MCSGRGDGTTITSRRVSLDRRASLSAGIESSPGSAWGADPSSIGRSHIEDGSASAVLQLRLEVVRAAAGLPEHANQAMAANSMEREIERKGGEEEDDQADAQVSSRLRDRMAKEISEPNPRPGPRQSAHGAVADEADNAHPSRTGESGADRVQLRQEPGTELKCPDVGGEDTLSATEIGRASCRERV